LALTSLRDSDPTRIGRYRLTARVVDGDLPAAVEVAAYRIALEAMTNALRHGGARWCRVGLELNGALQIVIEDVLELLAAGHSNTAIATRLGLSEKTVRNNVSAVLVKLRAADRPAAIIRAREAGIGTRTGEGPPKP
jgi:signal transduction histidine kinase